MLVFLYDSCDWVVVGWVMVVYFDGQWQLQVQVLYWCGDIVCGGQIVVLVFGIVVVVLCVCQLGVLLQLLLVIDDELIWMVVVISGLVIMYIYLVVYVLSSMISEFILWLFGLL